MHEDFLELLRELEEKSLEMRSWANAVQAKGEKRKRMNRLSFHLMRLIGEAIEVRMEVEQCVE